MFYSAYNNLGKRVVDSENFRITENFESNSNKIFFHNVYKKSKEKNQSL